MPLISIIIATRNAEKNIAACLESIQQNAPENTEVVVIDCCSTDQTLSIIRQSGIVNFISEKDKGIYDALNKGAMRANGKWLYFLGSDDSLLPGFKEMAQHLKNETTVYYGNTEAIYLENKKLPYHLLSGRFSKYRLSKYPVNHQAVIYPASVFKKYQYELKYKVFADYALNLKLWANPDFSVKYFPLAIANYNMTGFSSSIEDMVFKSGKNKLIRKHLGIFIWARYSFKKFRKKLKGEDWF